MSDHELQLARERSHQDAKTTNDNGRAAAQAAILINGGAATAILALASKEHPPSAAVLAAVPYALGVYAFGVVFGALMMFCMILSVQRWTIVWEGRVRNYPAPTIDRVRRHARGWAIASRVCFVFAVLCFAAGSIVIARGLS